MPNSPEAQKSLWCKFILEAQKFLWRKLIPLAIVLLLLCCFDCKYKFLYPLFERLKEGGSLEISGILKLGETERSEVRIEHAFESIPQCDSLRKIRKFLEDKRELYYDFGLPTKLDITKNVRETVDPLDKRYKEILSEWVIGNPLNEKENPSTFKELKKFFEEDFRTFVIAFKKNRPENRKDTYFVLSFIVKILSIFERELCKNSKLEKEIDIKKGGTEEYYSDIFEKFKDLCTVADYCDYVYYLCWVKRKNGEISENDRKTVNDNLVNAEHILIESQKDIKKTIKKQLEDLYQKLYLYSV